MSKNESTRPSYRNKDLRELQVLKYIDAVLELEGRVVINEVAAKFGLHRMTASNIMRIYKKAKPSNVRYETGPKYYLATFGFERFFLKEVSSFKYVTLIDLAYSSDGMDTLLSLAKQ